MENIRSFRDIVKIDTKFDLFWLNIKDKFTFTQDDLLFLYSYGQRYRNQVLPNRGKLSEKDFSPELAVFMWSSYHLSFANLDKDDWERSIKSIIPKFEEADSIRIMTMLKYVDKENLVKIFESAEKNKVDWKRFAENLNNGGRIASDYKRRLTDCLFPIPMYFKTVIAQSR